MAVLGQLLQLLSRTGYRCSGLGHAPFANGPAGTLLHHNIIQTWWDKMVIKSEASFPVSGKNINFLEDFYPTVLSFMNGTVPFAMVNVSECARPQSVQGGTEIETLLNPGSETCLQYVHVCSPASVNRTFDLVVNTRVSWWKQFSYNSSNFVQKTFDEGSTSVLHIQYNSSCGPISIETISNRGHEDIDKVEERTGVNCKFRNGAKSSYPCLIECQTSMELASAVFLMDAYTHNALPGEGQGREVLHLHPVLVPYKVSVCHNGSKVRQIQEVVTYICREFRKVGLSVLHNRDETNSLTAQVIRNDEMGVPYTVLVSDETIDTGNIGLRNRDTSIQETVPIGKLTEYLLKHVHY
ncbi:DNA polymerase subunit gamma-2, mitochondrial-like [Dreissena polymorpha]|nr:DNA polymerase subunit gamma-2, mitochondrial-like [Dreissena polymorpha]